MLDIQAELHGAGQAYSDLYSAVAALKARHDLHPCSVRPRDGHALLNDHDREAVQDLVARFRKLPEDARLKLPALMNSLAQLEIVVGDTESGQDDFEEVARLVEDPISRAEAHHNIHRAACERAAHDDALAALRRALALDADTFAPFPLDRYEIKSLLSAGAFGTRFLCHDRAEGKQVAVLALRPDSLDRDIHAVFRELRTVQDLDHPAIARITDLGFAGNDSRPYVASEWIDAEPLWRVVLRDGPLDADAWMGLAWP
ncbi:MAG: hypothetical protein K2W96_05960, partial [Gemmataceae bacterium]|nr:hypothetical protein [Gemmataceae bacterium]